MKKRKSIYEERDVRSIDPDEFEKEYFPDDYDDDAEIDDPRIIGYIPPDVRKIKQDIAGGAYDDDFGSVDIQKNVDGWDYGLGRDIDDRRRIIDKDYAFDALARDEERGRDWARLSGDMEQYLRGREQDRTGSDEVMGYEWAINPDIESEWAGNTLRTMYPTFFHNVFRKDGKRRSPKQRKKAYDWEAYGHEQADKRPLHRKGSWNRDLMDMDKKNKIEETMIRETVINENRIRMIVSDVLNEEISRKLMDYPDDEPDDLQDDPLLSDDGMRDPLSNDDGRWDQPERTTGEYGERNLQRIVRILDERSPFWIETEDAVRVVNYMKQGMSEEDAISRVLYELDEEE